MDSRIAVVGLGYVGLPVALAFSRKFPDTIGFDIDGKKVLDLAQGLDQTGETSAEELRRARCRFTSSEGDLRGSNFFVVAVPTPVDGNHTPDLSALLGASEIVGRALRAGSVVVYESTVYPGVTEEICGPVLAQVSGLRQGRDFKLGYSPERINPGDREHSLERVTKVVSGEDRETLDLIAHVYAQIIDAGVFRAESIKVAEAAKVIENTQRDLNIALMNELAIIFDRLGISSRAVLEAAGTKWNFLRFTPGLVGGHCIGVDPYYLTTKAEQVGYHPQVILAGRRINDSMGAYIAQRAVKLLINAAIPVKGARTGILGLAFKENVRDLRNSRVPDIVRELREFGIQALVHDPLISGEMAEEEYGISLTPWEEFEALDCVIFAVSHRAYLERSDLFRTLKPDGVFLDVRSAIPAPEVPAGIRYWSL